MDPGGWIAIGLGLLAIIGLGYWQLVIAEGVYLGQRVVTWLYDLTARRYDRIKGFDEHFEAVFLGEPLAELLTAQSGVLVLDVGTGTGRLPLALLAQPAFQGHIVGIDDSRPMLAVAREKMHQDQDKAWLIWRDASSLPFIDAAFDIVACLEMLEFTQAPKQQLREAVRVLRPGGVLVTTRRRGVDARLMPGKTYTKSGMDSVLRELGTVNILIVAWQVDYDLVWATRAGEPDRGYGQLLDVLRCPRCQVTGLIERTDALDCGTCGAWFAIREGIVEMHS